jgi:DNA-binding beta-propeller fold protein YncE
MAARGILLAVVIVLSAMRAEAADAPLVLEAKIPLGDVNGRIDHLAVDVKRQRLFVAELGNNSVGVVDLAGGKLLRSLTGFNEPQGVGYEPGTDTLYVANAGDGLVQMFAGADFAALGRIELGEDADNVRIDVARKNVLIGYGKGAIAVIDPATRAKGAEFRLRGHPESFQIDGSGTQLFINVPDAREISIIDLPNAAARSVTAGGLGGNFPMAVDREGKRILTVFRNPPTLMALASPDGQVIAKVETCGDADDVFVDGKRHRVYVTCGAGVVDVFEPRAGGYGRLAKIPTVSGARTGLFVPELDRLYVAVRAASGEPAAVWVFRPVP